MTILKTLSLAAFALLAGAALEAGDALTQSLEHETSHGTVAERQTPEASPSPAPTAPKRTMSDREAKKRVRIHRKGQKPPPRPTP